MASPWIENHSFYQFYDIKTSLVFLVQPIERNQVNYHVQKSKWKKKQDWNPVYAHKNCLINSWGINSFLGLQNVIFMHILTFLFSADRLKSCKRSLQTLDQVCFKKIDDIIKRYYCLTLALIILNYSWMKRIFKNRLCLFFFLLHTKNWPWNWKGLVHLAPKL